MGMAWWRLGLGMGRVRRRPRNRLASRCCNSALLRWVLWLSLLWLWLPLLLRLRTVCILIPLRLWVSPRLLQLWVLPALSIRRLLPLPSSLLSIRGLSLSLVEGGRLTQHHLNDAERPPTGGLSYCKLFRRSPGIGVLPLGNAHEKKRAAERGRQGSPLVQDAIGTSGMGTGPTAFS